MICTSFIVVVIIALCISSRCSKTQNGRTLPGCQCSVVVTCNPIAILLKILQIFDRYRNAVFAADTEKAVKGLNNRFFAGRRVKAQSYDMELYRNNDLSG